MYILFKEDNTYAHSNWAYQIKTLLQSHGLNYIWLNQTEIEIPFQTIKQRIIDTYKQSWYTAINNSPRLISYSLFKHEFTSETYIDTVNENKYRYCLSRFRISSHNLAIETGRYDNTPRENRKCSKCQMNQIENEYHFLLVCPAYRELRKKYFKKYYCSWPTINKFTSLMSNKSKSTLINISNFLIMMQKKSEHIIILIKITFARYIINIRLLISY